MSTPTFEEQVNTTVDSMVKDDKGSWTIPEDAEVSEELKFAAITERRRKDTQSAFTKVSQERSVLAAENAKLTESWSKDFEQTLTLEQQSELTELKTTDPDAWRAKLNEYESGNLATFEEKHKEIKAQALHETEEQRRGRLLEDYNTQNPEFQLTDDVVDNQLPASYAKSLSDGTITFDEFISKASTFLQKPRKIGKGGNKGDNEPDLSKFGGSESPAEEAINKEGRNSYKTEIY